MRKNENTFRNQGFNTVFHTNKHESVQNINSFRNSTLTQKTTTYHKIVQDKKKEQQRYNVTLNLPADIRLKFRQYQKSKERKSLQKNQSMRSVGNRYIDQRSNQKQRKIINFEDLHNLLDSVTKKYSFKERPQGSQTDRISRQTLRGQQDYDLMRKRDFLQTTQMKNSLASSYLNEKSKKLQGSKSTFNILHLNHKRTNSNSNADCCEIINLISQQKPHQKESFIQFQPMKKSSQKSVNRYSNVFQYSSQFSLSTNFTLDNKTLQLTDFIILNEIDSGRTGKVYRCLHRATLILCAIKVINKTIVKNLDENRFLSQIKIHQYIKHPNIASLYGFFSDEQNVYLVMQFCEDGSLIDKIKGPQLPSQKIVAGWLKSIIKALTYLHDLKIVHRDIKPENIILSFGVAKLCDFGCAAICKQRRMTNIGTFDYIAPQMLQNKQYDQNVDIWGLGVMTYELLTGRAPFYDSSKHKTINNILNQKITYPASMSPEAQSFINMLLIKQPKQRCSARVMLHHSFISKNCQDLNIFN